MRQIFIFSINKIRNKINQFLIILRPKMCVFIFASRSIYVVEAQLIFVECIYYYTFCNRLLVFSDRFYNLNVLHDSLFQITIFLDKKLNKQFSLNCR